MKKNNLIFLAIAVLITSCNPHPDPGFVKRDEQNLRDLFRVERSISMDNFFNYPPKGGRFGREGLVINATFHFSPDQMVKYLQKIEEDDWKPIPFKYRNIELEKEYTEASKKWKELPFPIEKLPPDRLRKIKNISAISQAKKGKYFCTMSRIYRDQLPLYFKRFGCEELLAMKPVPNEVGYVQVGGNHFTLGILDTENGTLQAHYDND